MNKKLSRIAAIALSAAMVTSAFAMSTSSAFASIAEQVPATINMVQKYSTIVKVNDSGTAFALPVTGAFDLANAKVNGETKDLSGKVFKITGVAKSGNSVSYDSASFDTTPLKVTGLGDTTLTYTVKVTDAASNKEYNSTVASTVKVVPADALVVAKKDTTGTGADLSGKLSVSTGETANDGLELVGLGANTDVYESNAKAYTFGANETSKWTSSNTSVLALADGTAAKYQGYKASSAGTATVSASTPTGPNHTVVPLSVEVKDNTTITASDTTGVTIAADPYDASKTYITGDAASTVVKSDVTSKDITLDATNMTGLTVKSGAKVGKIVIKNAPAAFVVLSVNGTTGDITFDSSSNAALPATTIGKGAVTGTIDLSKVTAPAATAVKLTADEDKDVTVAGVKLPTGSTLAVLNDTTKANKVNLGTVVADTVTVKGLAENAAKGAVTTDGTAVRDARTVRDASKYNQVAISALTATDTAIITTGVALTANDVALNVASNGKIASVVTTGQTKSSSVTIGSKADIATLTSANKEDSFTFTNGANITAATTATATGKGDATVVSAPANSLVIGSNTAGIIKVNLPGSFKAGDTWVTTTAKATVDLSAKPTTAAKIIPGNVTSADADSAKATVSGYAFLVSGKTVTGVAMDKTEVTLGLNDTATLTLNNQPAGAADYAKYEVKWTSSNPDFVTISGSGKTATITAVKYADLKAQATDNSSTITATYVAYDAGGNSYLIGSATTAVTVTAKTAPVLTTTVTDLDGKTTAVTADTVVKMTQSTYNTVDFSADKAGISEAALAFHTGNDKVAQTGTYTKWNGTAGKYNVYANGAVGSKVGVFANGVKVFQIEIVDRPFKCDTTLDLDGVKGKALTVGQKYSFKITPADGTKIDTFTFLTANDSAVASWGFVKNADGTVTATIKALKATDKIGVYAKINGVTYKVFAAAVK